MSEAGQFVEATDLVLGTVLSTMVHHVRLSFAPAELQLLEGRGATRRTPVAPEDPPEATDMETIEDVTRVDIAVMKLGAQFRGRPVPDGLLIDLQGQRFEAASYDCKSKKRDLYGLDAGDADQQARYLQILKRLEATGQWASRGVLLFTPSVAAQTVAEKTAKDPWRAFVAAGGRMAIVPATILRRWHELTSAEQSSSFRALFNSSMFWGALTRLEFPGLTDAQHTKLVGDRSPSIHLMTDAEGEMVWLAGFCGRLRHLVDAAESLRRADEERISASLLVRPKILQEFFEALREKKATFDSLATATGLNNQAIKYLLTARAFWPEGPEEAGAHGFASLDRLRREIGESGVI